MRLPFDYPHLPIIPRSKDRRGVLQELKDTSEQPSVGRESSHTLNPSHTPPSNLKLIQSTELAGPDRVLDSLESCANLTNQVPPSSHRWSGEDEVQEGQLEKPGRPDIANQILGSTYRYVDSAMPLFLFPSL